ncbi:thioredoxin [Clostridium cylindrosporum]|uniref:Thioredoxin n=1 Tax=Clostridium cylindrosporum DSM 605 TaxID=1121307 RepID=A0A0J8DGE5_CLOCY|nr:thioredoxin [Clostridium cylindrosporum]KMT23304.1 thioredoxin [Clostridium cylindrosporum DSM 605]
MVANVNDVSFNEEVVNAGKPVLVDFWAEWCMPCKMLSPVIEEVAKSLNGQVEIVKVNIDENPQSASQLGITSIPTLVLFNDGKLVSKIVGFQPKEQIEDAIKGALNL